MEKLSIKSNTQGQTFNSNEKLKVELRQKFIKDLPHNSNVLECFAGVGSMYQECYKSFRHTCIEKDVSIPTIGRNIIYGEALQVMKTLDINDFDVIDLDAFSHAWEEFDYIISKLKRKNTIIFITDGMGRVVGRHRNIPENLLRYINPRDCSFNNDRTGIFRHILSAKCKLYNFDIVDFTLFHVKKGNKMIYAGFRLVKN